MKTAADDIEKILMHEYSDAEWLLLDAEVSEWFDNASEEEQQEFADSGAGETLYMVCSGIDEDKAIACFDRGQKKECCKTQMIS